MQCTAEEIERKRKLAQERLAKRKLSSPIKPSNPVGLSLGLLSPKQMKFNNVTRDLTTPDLERNSNAALQKFMHPSKPQCKEPFTANTWQSKNSTMKELPCTTTSNFYPQNKTINCNCSLISWTRLTVEMFGFSQIAVETFKSVPSRQYDVAKKTWNFDIKDYNLLVNKFASLEPEIVLGKLPDFVIKCAKITENETPVDLSNIDEDIRTSLYPYQEDGVCFGIRKHGRCLLADDMGLGKTIQALAIAHYYRNEWPLLIVTTATMRNVWEENIHRFLPSVPLMKIQYLSSSKETIEDCLVLIISHDLMSRCVDKLLSIKQHNCVRTFGVLIVDESHILKNFQARCTQNALLLAKAAKRVILLSGTPALSKPSELFTQLQLIDQKFFGTFYDYSKRYCNGHQSQFGWNATGQSHLAELEVILAKKFMIRRTKESILKNLPDKVQEVVMLDVKLDSFSEEDRRNLKNLSDKYQSSEMKNGREKHALLLTFFNETARIKIPSVCSYILDTLENCNKFLVFAHHHVMLDAIASVLMKCRKDYIRIDGNVAGQHRKQLIDRYQTENDCVCALLSTTAANAGITLTAGHLVIFAELHWNPSILSQAESRAHRIGQNKQVIVKYLIATGTADDHIWPLLKKKQKTLQEIGLCKESFKESTVLPQKTSNIGSSGTDCLNSSITSKNTLDIASYFTQKKTEKNSSKEEEDFFGEDEFDNVLGNVELDFI